METEWMNETSAEAPSVPAPEKTEKKKFSLKGFGGKKKKRWLKILIILVVVIAIVAGCVSRLTKNVNTQLSSSYLVSTVTRQDLTVSVSGTATLQPADSYNVTTLLSGDIVSAPFEEGDLVTKDTLLYTMDSSDAQDSMDRAQISVQQAQMSYQQAQEALHPTAPISGTVSEIYVTTARASPLGTQLAKIVASTELSIDFLFPFASPSDFYVGQAATVFCGRLRRFSDGHGDLCLQLYHHHQQRQGGRLRPGAAEQSRYSVRRRHCLRHHRQLFQLRPGSGVHARLFCGVCLRFRHGERFLQAGRQHGDQGRGAVHCGVRDHPGPDRERTAEPPVRPALCQHCLRRGG